MTVRILQGDVRDRLAELPSDSFDCIVTSPPYWGLRDYGVAGQIGLEPTLTEYLDTMVAVCRDLRRVLKPSGTFWLNVGDSYAGGGRGGGGSFAKDGIRCAEPGTDKNERPWWTKGGVNVPAGLKAKDLCMVPNRLAIRLQEDGWYIRSEIIWHKPNPMPESVTDRPTGAHEKIWLLTKSERYFYDAGAVREGFADDRQGNPGAYKRTSSASKGANNDRQDMGFLNNGSGWMRGSELGGRNARNVWTIATQPYSEAHFATFPPELAERCIKAGCPVGGSVLDPFGGAGTTGMVADRLGRDATLIELNPSYIEIARERFKADAGMFAELECVLAHPLPRRSPMSGNSSAPTGPDD